MTSWKRNVSSRCLSVPSVNVWVVECDIIKPNIVRWYLTGNCSGIPAAHDEDQTPLVKTQSCHLHSACPYTCTKAVEPHRRFVIPDSGRWVEGRYCGLPQVLIRQGYHRRVWSSVHQPSNVIAGIPYGRARSQARPVKLSKVWRRF